MTFRMLVILAIALLVVVELYLAYHVRKLPGINRIESRKKRIIISLIIISVLFLLAALKFRLIFGIFAYAGMLFVVFDLLRLILKKVIKNEDTKKKLSRIYMGGLWVIIAAVIVSVYGWFNAHNYQIVSYDVSIEKEMDRELKIVLITDTHMGTSVDAGDLQKIVDLSNSCEPDIVLLGGDIFDEGTSDELFDESFGILAGLKSTYGTYYIYGNHDDGYHDKSSNRVKEIEDRFEAAGITVLVDEAVEIDGSFYLIGRSDPGTQKRAGEPMATVKELYKGLDLSKPVFVLNHKPVDIEEESECGADLFMAGHTHNGQMWPYNYLVKYFSSNEVVAGEKTFGNTTAITSIGAGTWMIPVKTTGPSEISFITVKGK
ncbi:MAG: metallophosphoesterase [Lachnospiraceae bacterium]|nr:metallophosphoesterase [Lachnospiraceae bacterium]